MERFDPSLYVENSKKITDIFGYWPSFHDAEIHELKLSIADQKFPLLEMQIHVFEMTMEVADDGYFVLRNHTLTQLRFRNVENLQLSDFWFQNCIFELVFGIEPMVGAPADDVAKNILTIKICSSVGLCGEFTCHAAEVVSVEPCDASGKPINPAT